MFNKILPNITRQYKSHFYLKSSSLKTDFSRYKKDFLLYHPRYFDVIRTTERQKKIRDSKKLQFNTMDPLHFDYNMTSINGGFQMLLDHIKYDRKSSTTYSVYRVVYIIYHMAKNNIMDIEFFDELENSVTPTTADMAFLNYRVIFGALYAYYKFNRGKPENIIFFENCLETNPGALHTEMSLELFELAHRASIMDPDRLSLFITNFFRPNFLLNWDKNISTKPRILAEFFNVFLRVNFVDDILWTKLIESSNAAKRIQNMDNYHDMLKGMIWYNENPKSPNFQQVTEQIELFKDRIRKSENRTWRYDVENNRWKTYEDLLTTREAVDTSFCFAFIDSDQNKGDRKVVQEKKVLTLEDIKVIIKKKISEKETNFSLLK